VDGTEVVREDVETLDVAIADYALSHLSDSTEEQQPFYVVVSFLSPHRPFVYEERYADAFADEPLPSPPNFNQADVSDKPSYVRERPRLTRKKIDDFAGRHRDRLRSLQTVDNAIRKIVTLLEDTGKLHNTYFFYYTDHGLNLGQHRLSGKRAPYAQAWSFPLMVRGPGVPQGVERDELVLNTDLAPTLADLGGAEIPNFVDGRSIAPLLRGEEVPWREAALIEQWHDRRESQGGRTEVPTYKAVRTRDALYVEYETGERELYDLANDPYQLENLYHRPAYSALLADLQARLDALRNCTGKECHFAEG
jgi:arylsulfatase A-like enzyme